MSCPEIGYGAHGTPSRQPLGSPVAVVYDNAGIPALSRPCGRPSTKARGAVADTEGGNVRGCRCGLGRVGARVPGIVAIARFRGRRLMLPYKAFPRTAGAAPSAVLECLPHEKSHICVSPGEAAKTNKFPQLVKKFLDGLDISSYSSKLQLFRSFADAPEGGKASWPKTKMLVRQYFIAIAARLRRFLTSWTCPTSSPFKRIVSNGS